MTVRKCARCRQPYEDAPEIGVNAAKSYAPFCSKRCADVDLVHWLKGDYVIDGAGGLAIDEDETVSEAPPHDADGDRF